MLVAAKDGGDLSTLSLMSLYITGCVCWYQGVEKKETCHLEWTISESSSPSRCIASDRSDIDLVSKLLLPNVCFVTCLLIAANNKDRQWLTLFMEVLKLFRSYDQTCPDQACSTPCGRLYDAGIVRDSNILVQRPFQPHLGARNSEVYSDH